MRQIALIVFILACSVTFGQSTDDRMIRNTVDQLFDGMREADSSKVRKQFLPKARMTTTWFKDGKPVYKEGSLKHFCKAVGTPHDQQWNEVLTDTIVQIDGGLAHVWTPYQFHLGDKKLHSGVNSFQMVKTTAGWKILNLTDSRRKM